MTDSSASISAQQLRNFVDRIERLEQDKAGIAGDIRGPGEAKALGYDVKILRKGDRDPAAASRRGPRREWAPRDLHLSAIDDQLPLIEPGTEGGPAAMTKSPRPESLAAFRI